MIRHPFQGGAAVHADQLRTLHLEHRVAPTPAPLRPVIGWINHRIHNHRFRAETGQVRRRRQLRLAMSRAVARAVVDTPGAARAYERVNGPARVVFRRIILPVAGLPASLERLRVAQVTDVHHGPWLPVGYIADIMRQVNDARPDLVLLTGDYVINSPCYIEPVVRAFAALRPGIATLAVLGNHDWWEGVRRMRSAFAAAGIPLLDNRRAVVTPERGLVLDASVRHDAEGLAVAGVGDYWEDRVDAAAALGGLPAAMPRIVMSHNPDVAEDHGFLAAGERVDLMVSGHTHGGQVCLPRFGAPVVPSIHGQKYLSGWVEGPAFPVYINNGIGTSGLPVRFGAPAEVTLFDLVRPQAG